MTLGSGTALGVATSSIPDSTDLTVDDDGVLDLNANDVTVTSLNSSYAPPGEPNGIITNNNSGNITTTLTVYVGGTPGVFAGKITDGAGELESVALNMTVQAVTAEVPGEGLLMTLTGGNAYTGGTSTVGALQIGDGISNGSIEGLVSLYNNGEADDLVFDVAAGTEVFDGEISSSTDGGSLLKTGDGLLELTGDTNWGSPGFNDYDGITRVEGGTLELGDGTALPANSSVIIDNGATLDLHHYSFTGNSALTSLTLNDGTIESTPSATLEVTSLIEVGCGSIFPNLTGAATLLKSPDVGGVPADTVNLSGDNNYSGATIVSAGTLMLGGGQGQGISDASSLIVNGGTLDLNGSGTLADPVEVASVTMTSAGGAIVSNATSAAYAVLAADSYFFAPDAADPGTVSVVLTDPSGAAGAIRWTASAPSTSACRPRPSATPIPAGRSSTAARCRSTPATTWAAPDRP